MATVTLQQVSEIGGYAVWVLGAFWALAWCHGVRSHLRQRGEVERPTLNEAMLACAAVVLIPILRLSPYHLLWMLPLAKLVAILTALFPRPLLLLLGAPGWLFERPFLLGLNSWEIVRSVAKPCARANLGVYFSSRASGMSHTEALHRMVETRYPLSAVNRDAVLSRIRDSASTASDSASEPEQVRSLVYTIFAYESGIDSGRLRLAAIYRLAACAAISEVYDEMATMYAAALPGEARNGPQG